MSNWTHVAGIVRVDAIRIFGNEIDFEKHFGKQTPEYPEFPGHGNDVPKEKLEKFKQDMIFHSNEIQNSYDHPDEYLPHGSEGTLKMNVWVNPNENSMAAYTVSIWGDLRDHDSADEVVEWFKKKCSKLRVRNASIVANNELNGTSSWFLGEK